MLFRCAVIDRYNTFSASSKFSRLVSILPASLFDLLFIPKMKRVGENHVAEEIMSGSIVNVEGGIHLKIAGDVASETNGG